MKEKKREGDNDGADDEWEDVEEKKTSADSQRAFLEVE